MSEHLPECPMADPNDRECCCCKELRACEERVLRDMDSVYGQGFQDGREWMLAHFTDNPTTSPAKAKPADLHDRQMGEMIHGDR